ncbi:M20 family metallo-hydrolase [Pseudonocardia parietis]|uniref:N-carbamoyl-L-amino-acid hydrolase n=1 Tax=Pseudonocardia parietis TaxID=570936 RepID=A0ABS4VP97_9PSEU|nr:M20 family metallo-hydrolase [Pseudonocardia parietis]MBP2365394.1 N-carbamoyl-L-amino-acid hydrolase [Pseudonocardia parietis]
MGTGDFLDDFATLSTFGATERGGVHREAASDADEAQRAWFERWLTDRGFTVRYDGIGNQFGLLETAPGAPYVLVGSHLDSQPYGGRYDGAYGVLAAAHAVHRLAGAGGLVHNLAVVNWFNEEGSRFTPSMFGSAVFTGLLDLDAALDTRDPAGVRVGDRLAAMGHTGTGAPVLADLAGYAEIHIEQGRLLEETPATIGLVADTWAARKYDLRVLGDQSHTGSTPMADRQDALLGAAHLVVAARGLSDELSTPDVPLHTSASRMAVEPNSPVTVAREVTLNLDLRSPDEDLLARADAALHERIPVIERAARVSVEVAGSQRWGVRPFPAAGVELARRSAEELGLTHREISTVAGHDSVNLNGHVPTVMLFVPSVAGISHNEGELTHDDDALAGVDLLAAVVRRLAAGEITGPPPGAARTRPADG